ncbi:MAG: DUF4349 domain-containing protein [Beijerinckiaceae bacterium]
MRKLIATLFLGGALLGGMVGLRYVAATPAGGLVGMAQEMASFSLDRKNYASQKMAGSTGPSAVESQKYEKIATIGLSTTEFETHRSAVDRLVRDMGGQVQLERLQGLAGRRMLNLGIGVPPEQFDAFIEQARKLGKETGLTIVKNDKTNDYLKLRARRATLEKTRTQLETLQAAGGSVDERLKVQAQLFELEEKIQEMGVSLGEFDVSNELCTVKLTLAETRAVAGPTELQRWQRAISGALPDFAFLTFGLLAVAGTFWLAAGLFQFGRRMLSERA